MNIDTLPKHETHETESIKPFKDVAQAIAWFENAAQKLGQSTTLVKGSRTQFTRTKVKSIDTVNISEPDNTELAKLFSDARVEILLQNNKREISKNQDWVGPAPEGGRPQKDTGSYILIDVVDEAGGEYNLTLDKSIGESEFFTAVESTLSYTTDRGTNLEQTAKVKLDTKQQEVDPETISEYLKMAAALRSTIMWKVESLAPEMKDELEADVQRTGIMKKALGRLAWGKSATTLLR